MKLEDCQCKRGEKAIYYCDEGENCEFSQSNFLYCELCNEERIHDHITKIVNRRVGSEGQIWMMVKSRANQKLQSTQNNHEKYKKVIGFMESVAEEKKIQIDETPNNWRE